jgi:hypothetical protein
MPASDVTMDNLALLQPQGGFTGSVDQVTGAARAKFLSVGSTDKDGRFDISVPIDGEVVVVAYPNGHRPVEVDVGALNRDREFELTAEPVLDPTFLCLVAKGKPLVRANVLVCDLSLKDGDVQPGHNLMTDADGRISADWFIAGRRYFFDIEGFSGHMVWNGQETIDVVLDLRSISDLPRPK